MNRGHNYKCTTKEAKTVLMHQCEANLRPQYQHS